MSINHYTPDVDEVRDIYCDRYNYMRPEANAQFERFLDRVKQDAAREALDGFERKCDEIANRFRADGPEISVRQRERAAEFAALYRDHHYPEEPSR